MDLSWASLPSGGDPAVAEWLEGASCGPHVKALAVRAVDAAGRGISAPHHPLTTARNIFYNTIE
jgi:hypothetical protein